jgi:uncharacterized protein YjbI with pentapeptide repeats
MSDGSGAGRELRRVRDSHRALGLWSMRRALTVAFSGAVVLLVGAWFFVSWLLGSPPRAKAKPLDVAAQLELLKLVFALVAGSGALVALVTAYRRQRIDEAAGERAERAQAHAEQVARDNKEHAERLAASQAHDATERRVTDLYGQAVEQLGHDKAAVRLGGLYSLERLAQDHAQHRQTVVDVVCAYLRMPFSLPASSGEQQAESDSISPGNTNELTDQRQELQVRLAAQRLLARHLEVLPATPNGTGDPNVRLDIYWDDIFIDLNGAHLINFHFSHCRLHQAIFEQAEFSGDSHFGGTQFNGDAWFGGAQFNGVAWFLGAQFSGDAIFTKAQLSESVMFGSAQFGRDAMFEKVQFSAAVVFIEAQFGRNAWFREAEFRGPAMFRGAQFSKEPDFLDAAGYPNDGYTWPTPWELEASTDETGMARLVRRQ